MKRAVLCTICLLLLFVGGCNSYWYKPDKTIEQALQDSSICNQTWSIILDNPFLYADCMRRHGYREFTKEQLPAGIKTRDTDAMGFTKVAGK